ncbi:MAG: hypothetical protein LC650_05860, partial [Actinobacteria bacterium]|nr:hypothetical protein [Actinomycetota bacterium]
VTLALADALRDGAPNLYEIVGDGEGTVTVAQALDTPPVLSGAENAPLDAQDFEVDLQDDLINYLDGFGSILPTVNGVVPVGEYAINTVGVDPVVATDVTVTQAQTAFTTVETLIDGAVNSSSLDLPTLFEWSIEDTLANLTAAPAVIIDGASEYTLADASLTAADVEDVTVAELAAAQADAVQDVRDNPIVDGATNGDTIPINNGDYTLEDTLANLTAAPAGIVDGASEYTLTDSALTAADVEDATVAGLAGAQADAVQDVRDNPIVDGATNGDTIPVNNGDYTLEDTLANLTAAPAGIVDGAESYSISAGVLDAGTVTVAEAQTAYNEVSDFIDAASNQPAIGTVF